MNAPPGSAKHSLYLATILIEHWAEAVLAQDVPVQTLTQAYLPAVRERLASAYGCFLLELAGQVENGADLPRRCAEISPDSGGKLAAGEIDELQALESQGWLSGMLGNGETANRSATSPPSSTGNSAADTTTEAGCLEAQDWARELGVLFDRMLDAVDEH